MVAIRRENDQPTTTCRKRSLTRSLTCAVASLLIVCFVRFDFRFGNGVIDVGNNVVIDGDNAVIDGGNNAVIDGGNNAVIDGGNNGAIDGDTGVIDGDNAVIDGGDNGVIYGRNNGVIDGGNNGVIDGGNSSAFLPPPDRVPSLQVIVAHEPKNDLLGSFVTPTLLLYAIASYHGWKLEILPYTGSDGAISLTRRFALGDKIDKAWGSGFQDASNREDYNPMKLNTESSEVMGFFPMVSDTSNSRNWTRVQAIPLPGVELDEVCHNHEKAGPNACYIWLPGNPYLSSAHMDRVGGNDLFFSPEFRERTRSQFLEMNGHRLQHYNNTEYNIAVHVRRGDILDPRRWIEQHVYVNVVLRVCKLHPGAKVHVFSAGKNRDGNWSAMESLADGSDGSKCGPVLLHLDEPEFDTWTHMVAADTFIMSKSAFSVIPALLSGGEVHYPDSFRFLRLSCFHVFNTTTGDSLEN